MKKIINKYLILSLLFASALVGCDKGFQELNVDPNNPSNVPADLLLGQMQFDLADALYSTFVGADMGSCWSQQMAKTQYNDEARYAPRPTVITNFWDDFYKRGVNEAIAMYKLAEQEGNNNLMGVALVMKAYAFNVLTDTYGDIPFSEAGLADTGLITPKYDAQQDVYAGILNLYDQAAALLGTGGTINANTDLIYHGDATQWKRFANSLKFRALMRISKKMDVSAQLQALIDGGMLFSSEQDNAAFQYKNENPNANPLYESIVFGSRLEFKVCDQFVDRLVADSDPRIAQMVEKNDAGNYRGKPAGIADVPNVNYNVLNVSGLGPRYLDPTLPGYFMTYSELEFLIAEAITRSDINISAGSANTHFHNGITASFIDSNTSLTLLPSFLANQNLGSTESVDLELIATQNWIGLFCQGVESFIEQRRTGYPVIPMPIDPYISSFALRYTYPTEESSVNAVNYQAAVANQGGDALTTVMWRLQP